MLSVINRGSIVGDESEGIPYKIVDGYETGSYQGNPLSLIKLENIPSPLVLTPDVEILNGYLTTQGISLGNVDVLKPTVQPIIKNGYTQKNVTPTEG